MTLFRWAFWLCAICALAWLAFTVPLGSRTLVQHLRAIASTPEAKSLAEGTRDEAAKVSDRVRQQLGPLPGDDSQAGHGAGPTTANGAQPIGSAPPNGAPAEQLDDHDRQALDRAVRERTRARHHHAAE